MSGEGQNKMSGGSLFDIVGPVMVGPSSSHTAGAVRLANLAKLVADKPIEEVEFILYNSFAQTYKGHGTDRGLIAGLLGYSVNDERIRDAFELAEQQGLKYKITPFTGANNYSPNTVVFKLTLTEESGSSDRGQTARQDAGNTIQSTEKSSGTGSKKAPKKSKKGEIVTVVGHSIGGGKVYISKIDDFNVSIKGELPTLILLYKDQPGMIWQVTKIIAERHVNIASLTCNRQQRGEQAFMIITMDSMLDKAAVDEMKHIATVDTVRCIDRLPA